MQATGYVRKLDQLGRIVLPKKLRKSFDISDKDGIEYFTEGNMIILQKYKQVCYFCGDVNDVNIFKDKNICKGCIDELEKIVE